MVTKRYDDGGPAFPVPSPVFEHATKGELIGMALWDYYAAAALQGLLARDGDAEIFAATIATSKKRGVGIDVVYAGMAAIIADAMIAERRKRGIGT